MHWSEIALVAVLLLALVILICWRAATRIDKLHRKAAASNAALEILLNQRARLAVDLAASHLLDPTSAVLLAQAGYAAFYSADEALPQDAIEVGGFNLARERDESDLTATLRVVFPDAEAVADIRADPLGRQLVDSLASTWYRATLARRIHNQAVADARASRRHWWVRLLHLAGNAPLPETVELDDSIPSSLPWSS